MDNKVKLSQPRAPPSTQRLLPQGENKILPEIWDGNNSGWTKVVRKTRGKNKKKQ
jgi:hypothetical protein